MNRVARTRPLANVQKRLMRAVMYLLALGSGGASYRPSMSPESIALAKKTIEGRIERADAKFALPYRLFVPPTYSSAEPLPLVLFLHGSGSNGDDNLGQIGAPLLALTGRAQEVQPAFVLAPQCPRGTKWLVRQDARPPYHNYRQSDHPEGDAARLALDAVFEVQSRYAIDPDRIYVTGYSSGSTGTWDMITRHPDVFAAAITATGANDPSRAPAVAKMPIWAFHGARDDVSPTENTREMVRALRQLGSPIRYTEFPDVAHRSWDIAYEVDGLFEWLFSQSRSGR